MSRFIEFVARKAKNNKTLKKAYQSTVNSFLDTHIGEITPFNLRGSENSGRRLNLLVPSINQEHLFGGISTALQFFDQMHKLDETWKKRIITTDASPGEEDMHKFSEYTLNSSDTDLNTESQLVPFNDRYNKTMPIGKEDIFIATSWWTAYFAQRIVQWQSGFYNQPAKKIIYFIQDFEPGFYSWSSQYSLALSTYRYKGQQIAVFNSSLLKEFFNNHGFNFTEEYFFEPRLNQSLKKFLVPFEMMNKKKKILIYGRPSVPRNAFSLIIEMLRNWVWIQPNSAEWEIVSAGEQHNDIDVGNGVIVKSKGKMSLDEYANELKESAIGVSLMISPHPSYPPLEMSHFGMLVLTNSYENKNLAKLHGNIFSVDDVSPDSMARELVAICSKFTKDKTSGDSEGIVTYLDDGRQFEFLECIKDKI